MKILFSAILITTIASRHITSFSSTGPCEILEDIIQSQKADDVNNTATIINEVNTPKIYEVIKSGVKVPEPKKHHFGKNGIYVF